jgi:hypothetical protein
MAPPGVRHIAQQNVAQQSFAPDYCTGATLNASFSLCCKRFGFSLLMSRSFLSTACSHVQPVQATLLVDELTLVRPFWHQCDLC